MTNAEIAAVLEQVADLLEFKNENPFRVRAYRNGARAIHDLPESVASIVADNGQRLLEIDGIGKAVAEKAATLARTGHLPQLNELLAEIPASVLAMMRIPGVGPKKAAAVFHQLGVATLDDLKTACEAGRVRGLKGFGAKTEKAILDGIAIAASAGQRLYWAEADQIAQALREHLQDCGSIEQLELAGSYRRGRDTVGDLDVLAVAGKPEEVMDRFGSFPSVADVLGRGDTKMSVRLSSGFQIDLRIVPRESFGAALQYFTGSKAHNIVLRGLAKQRGLKINEYGVFRVEGDRETYVAGAAEADVYATLDLPCFPPELREARREFDWAQSGGLPELVCLEDIRGDLHAHTSETDGRDTLEQMAEAARQRGLKYLAITDHSQRVTMAHGLDPKRLLAQWEQIDRLNDKLGKGFTLLKGIECDILEKGGLDLPDDVLAGADWVVASVHYGQKQPREQITQRILDALANPFVCCIGHPTGRLLNKREGYELDLDAVFAAAAQHGKMLELNAHPMRLDLDDVACAAAKAHGVPIVISTDAHQTEGLDDLRYGILQARRGGLTRADVANTLTWPQLKKRLAGRAP
ncbi:MAG: DNA polymerase/3'-5' exonuclease PolX [Candidatus Anammoximicrobium sp.]|nr:DNA polymerase/3'-5' exonuclease PolX [Candidatus Anammoximicrobium sp.]